MDLRDFRDIFYEFNPNINLDVNLNNEFNPQFFEALERSVNAYENHLMEFEQSQFDRDDFPSVPVRAKRDPIYFDADRYLLNNREQYTQYKSKKRHNTDGESNISKKQKGSLNIRRSKKLRRASKQQKLRSRKQL